MLQWHLAKTTIAGTNTSGGVKSQRTRRKVPLNLLPVLHRRDEGNGIYKTVVGMFTYCSYRKHVSIYHLYDNVPLLGMYALNCTPVIKNKDLNGLYSSLYSSPKIVRVIKSRRRWAGHAARMEEGKVLHKVLVEKLEGKRPLGRPRCRWEDNTKIDVQEGGRGCGDCMELAQDRGRWRALVSSVMNFRVP